MTPTSTRNLIDAGSVGDHASPFGLPRGIRGRLAGWYMTVSDRQHRELVELVPARPGIRLLEIGFGPGATLRTLRRRGDDLRCMGVDPSEIMVAAARRRNPGADLRLGAAASLPFADDSADLILAVNNVPMWPDLDAALAEVRRVLSPDGHLMVAWHGGTRPVGHQRTLVLDSDRLGEIDWAMAGHISGTRRRTLEHSELWSTMADR